jgi:hypothetical protein
MLLLVSVFALLGAECLYETWVFNTGGTGTVLAEVTEARRGPKYRSYVRYRFQVDDSPTWYTHREWFGAVRNAEAGVANSVWDQARRTGRIQVAYSRSDPRRNMPAVDLKRDRVVAVVGFILFGPFTVYLWYCWLVRTRRTRSTAPVPSETLPGREADFREQ